MSNEDIVYGIYECADCQKDYTIERREAQFYKDKGFDLPKRCPACRKIRRQNKVDAMSRHE